ncbi:alkene reductase [Rhodotorula paludigena]|uniref:NADH:flavin oxidoreductase/NADH oxidase N-terminal domain-containing protein n=1 Tax=Rhodotorula paludigena TaxID=86838 RepID=A0AAV5GN66_9BASI|nr:hypothetical protein Rhopal_004656-T1 [Rhodotorula paludigena]
MPSAQPDIFTPFTLGGGAIELKHRVVMAPLTRNRGTKSEKHDRTWIANDLMRHYYEERATDGGMLISEATPVSLEASGMPGVPGTFTDEQLESWKPVTAAVKAKGGVFFAQLWHQGRNTASVLTGSRIVSASDVPITDAKFGWRGLNPKPFEAPHALTIDEVRATQDDFARAAGRAREAGFDGVELHAANGYLFDQFHHTNVNLRDDIYGGSIENRNRFTLETVDKVIAAVGADRVGVRLAPFGMFNQVRGEQRQEQWTALCEELGKKGLAYVHFIEPRFDELQSEAEKLANLDANNPLASLEVSLRPYREALGPSTPVIAAGNYNGSNMNDGLGAEHDLVAFGRYFCSNEDLVERLRTGAPLWHYNRSRFYGPFPDNEIGYTVHPERKTHKPGERIVFEGEVLKF